MNDPGEDSCSEARLGYSRSNLLRRTLPRWASHSVLRGTEAALMPGVPGNSVAPACLDVRFHCQHLNLTGSQVRVAVVRPTPHGCSGTAKNRQQECQAGDSRSSWPARSQASCRREEMPFPLSASVIWTQMRQCSRGFAHQSNGRPSVVIDIRVCYDWSSILQMPAADSGPVMDRADTRGSHGASWAQGLRC